jgi:hypothetical protein
MQGIVEILCPGWIDAEDALCSKIAARSKLRLWQDISDGTLCLQGRREWHHFCWYTVIHRDGLQVWCEFVT